MTFWMKTIKAFKKRLEIFIEKSLDVSSNYHWVISQYEKPLEHYQSCLYKNVGKFSSLDCLFLNKLKFLTWGNNIYNIFIIHYFGASWMGKTNKLAHSWWMVTFKYFYNSVSIKSCKMINTIFGWTFLDI